MALNQDIRWVPEHIKDGQFGKWLENARDWSITRNRFWGSPVPGVEVRRRAPPARRRLRLLRGDRARLRHAAARQGRQPRPAPPVRRRADAAQPRRPDREVDDAPRHRRPRRVVRLRLDVVRAGALPVREQGLVRQPLPRRLHRRVHRPDPRLVLHDARPGGRDLRPAGVLDVPQPRHRARQRRPEDVEVAAQLPRRARGLRPRRRRRDALVPHVEPDPARRQPRRHRAGHPRLGASGADPAVEQLVLLQPVRQRGQGRRGLRRHVAHRQRTPDGPLHPGQAARLRRRDDRPARQLRGGGGVRLDAQLPRRADQLVHPTLPRALLGRGRRRVRHPPHGARGRLPRHRAADAADHRGGLARPHRRALGPPDRLAVRRRPARRRVAGRVDGHRPRRLLGRLGAAQGRQPPQPPPAGAPDRRHRRRPRRLRAAGRRRAEPQGRPGPRGRRARGGRRTASRSGSRSTPARPVRASARTSSWRSRARSPATGRSPTTGP